MNKPEQFSPQFNVPGKETITNKRDDMSTREHKKKIKEIIKSRLEQSVGSRLAEYITGLKSDNVEIVDRLIEDQKVIRTKYGLPALDIRYNMPAEYERSLKDLAKKYKVDIRSTLEYGKYFKENPSSDAVYSKEPARGDVFSDINKKDLNSYLSSLKSVEHELIHAMQEIKFPRMPIELSEYEAYIGSMNLETFQEHPENVDPFFEYFICGSVREWYDSMSKEKEQNVSPEWEDPEFFLKNVDKISSQEIDDHMRKGTFLGKIFKKTK